MNLPRQRPEWLPFAALYVALAVFFAWYATVFFHRYPVSAPARTSIYLSLLLLLGLCLAPGFPALRRRLQHRLQGVPAAVCYIAFFLAPYLLYAAGTHDFRLNALAAVFAFAALPAALFAAAPVRRPERPNPRDAAVLVLLIWPVMLSSPSGIWNVPVNLDFMARLFLLGIAAWSFLLIRGVENAGYEFRWPASGLRDFLLPFASFSAIAIPLGMALHFIAWNPQWRGPWALLFDFGTIFLFVALVEELLFRGVLQNLLEKSLGSRYAAQALAALCFGLSHIRHAPFPNWRYVALATVAGWFYGSAYRSHRSLMTSAAVHALVDTLWRTCFTLPKG